MGISTENLCGMGPTKWWGSWLQVPPGGMRATSVKSGFVPGLQRCGLLNPFLRLQKLQSPANIAGPVPQKRAYYSWHILRASQGEVLGREGWVDSS